MLRFRDLICLYFSWNSVGDVSVPRGNSGLFVHQGIKLSVFSIAATLELYMSRLKLQERIKTKVSCN